MILQVAKLVGTNVRIIEPNLALLDATESIIELSIARADRLYFGTE